MSAPTAMLNATCSLAVRQRSVAMDPWILDPRTAGETQNFLAGPPKFRGEFRSKVGPTQKNRETWTRANVPHGHARW